jgi:hypothetical protein
VLTQGVCDLVVSSGAGRNGVTRRSIDQLSIDTIRILAIDAVQTAKSGHPGTAMPLAPRRGQRSCSAIL